MSSRFLNVIGLFNGAVPFIAIRMQAVQHDDKVGLIFTTVLDELVRSPDEEHVDDASRVYWEKIAAKETVAVADRLLALVRELDRNRNSELKYNKEFIGLMRDSRPYHFVRVRPTKKAVRLSLRLGRSQDVDDLVQENRLETLKAQQGWYRVRLWPEDMSKNEKLIRELLRRSYEGWQRS